jgi:hypothetical protein
MNNYHLDQSGRVEYDSIPIIHTEQFVATLTKLVGLNGGEAREAFKSRTQFFSSSYLGEQAVSQNPWVKEVLNTSSSNDDAAVGKDTGRSGWNEDSTRGVSKGQYKETIASDTIAPQDKVTVKLTHDTLLDDDIELSILPEPKLPLKHRHFVFEDHSSSLASELDDDLKLTQDEEDSDIKHEAKSVDKRESKENKDLADRKVSQLVKYNDQKASK